MKTLFQMLLFVAFLGSFAACSSAPEGKQVEAKAAKEETKAPTTAKVYTVDTNSSQVNWVGTKPTGQHMGTLQLSGGNLAVVDGAITAGEFTLNMNSITNTDMKAGEGKEDLEGHLKNNDFFEVEKFSTGKFVITDVKTAEGIADATHEITGNLTLKDQTKSVTLPANVNITDNKITAVTPSFTIDRTIWGITYKSTTAGALKDKAINDQIGLVINLTANAMATM